MEEDLALLLENPFPEERKLPQLTNRNFTSQSILPNRPEDKFLIFKNRISTALEIHLNTTKSIRKLLFDTDHVSDIRAILSQYGIDLEGHLNDLDKAYRTYIETAIDNLLDNEARRMERRFFPKTNIKEHIDFLKLKRYYEKIKTFNDIAQTLWREIQKSIDRISIIPETGKLSQEISEQHLSVILNMVRKTDAYLSALKLYMNIDSETIDPLTGSCHIVMTYNPQIQYTIPAFFGEESERDIPEIPSSEQQEETIKKAEKSSSIAKNIVLETREHKLNRSSIFSTIIPGSRDWNRTPSYYMELPVREYEEEMEKFKIAYHVSIKSESRTSTFQNTAIMSRKNYGASVIEDYVNLIFIKLREIATNLLRKDFPGQESPMIFLYHCGPKTIYNILISTLQQENIGEIFYLKNNKTTEKEFPNGILKREVIEWWNEMFQEISGEAIDSFVVYSRAVEMVKKDYRASYEEALALRKKETGKGYAGFEEWLLENQKRIFGIRKIEVYKRFVGDVWFDKSEK